MHYILVRINVVFCRFALSPYFQVFVEDCFIVFAAVFSELYL